MPGDDDEPDHRPMGAMGYSIWLGAVEAGASPLEAMFVTAAFFRGIAAADNFKDSDDTE